MAQFNIGLNAQIVGASNIRNFRSLVKSLGGDLHETTSELVELNGVQTRVSNMVIRNFGRMTAAQKAKIEATIADYRANRIWTSSSKEVTNASRQIATYLKNVERAQQAAARATTAHANALANLAQRQQILNQNQQIRVNQAASGRIQVANAQQALFNQRQAAIANAQQQRFNQQQQLNQQRHALAMQRISAYHRGTGGILPEGVVNGGIMKVLAYDALRRTLTNVYQQIGQIGDKIKDWTVEAVNFNDEMARSRTVFEGLGILGQKNPDGTQMTLKQAEQSTNPKAREAFAKSEQFASQMMNRLQSVTIETGQDMNEVISSARQLLPDLINKRKARGYDTSALLESPDMFANVTEKMVRMAAVLKMSDPGGRKLGWHMVALQELMSGTSGGAKDKGMEIVKSMRTREGIRISEKEALPIANAVNSGDLDKALELITAVMERSGQGASVALNQLANTLGTNLDAFQTALKIMAGDFTKPLWEGLKSRFNEIRLVMSKVLKTDSIRKNLENVGKIFEAAFVPAMKVITKAVDDFAKNPDKYIRMLRNFSMVTADGAAVWLSATMAIAKFTGSFLGITNGNMLNTQPIKNFMSQLDAFAPEFGEKFNKITQGMIDSLAPITENIVPGLKALTDTAEKFGKTISQIESALHVFKTIASIVNIAGTSIALFGHAFKEIIASILKLASGALAKLGINKKLDVGVFSRESLDQEYNKMMNWQMENFAQIAKQAGLIPESVDTTSLWDKLDRNSNDKTKIKDINAFFNSPEQLAESARLRKIMEEVALKYKKGTIPEAQYLNPAPNTATLKPATVKGFDGRQYKTGNLVEREPFKGESPKKYPTVLAQNLPLPKIPGAELGRKLTPSSDLPQQSVKALNDNTKALNNVASAILGKENKQLPAKNINTSTNVPNISLVSKVVPSPSPSPRQVQNVTVNRTNVQNVSNVKQTNQVAGVKSAQTKPVVTREIAKIEILNNKPISLDAAKVAQNIKISNKPIAINPNSMKMEYNFNFSGITVNANNPQEFIDKFVKLGKGSVTTQGPMPTSSPSPNPNKGAARGGY